MEKIINSIQIETVCEPKYDHRAKADNYLRDQVHTLETIQKNMKELISTAVENNILEFNRMSIKDQHKRRIESAIRANWAVSHKNLLDNILSVVNDVVLHGKNHWIDKLMLEDDKIKVNAYEDAKIIRGRKDHSELMVKMNECSRILNAY